MQASTRHTTNDSGFSLVETLVVLTVLAVAMLPLASTQFSSRRAISEADRQTQALQIAVEQVERARMGGFGAAIQDTIQNGKYQVVTQVVADAANPFLEEVQVVVSWSNTDAAPRSLVLSSKRAGR